MIELAKENIFLNTWEKKEHNFLGFSYFKIFWKKIFSKKYIFISLFIIIINAFVAVTLLPNNQYFSVFLIFSLFMIVFLLYLNFFSFRESHYYRFLKNEKHFDLKIYLNLFFVIFIFSFIIYGIIIFTSWIFSFLEFGITFDNSGSIFSPAFNWITWQWSFITYNFILTIFLSFAFCLFIQQIFNSQKKFFLFFSIFFIYFIGNTLINNIILHSYYINGWEYVYDEINNELVIIENFTTYYNFNNSTIYVIPRVSSNHERNFFQIFTIFTNPFYANALFIDLATSLWAIDVDYVNLDTVEVFYRDIYGNIYPLGEYGDFNVRIDFTQFTYDASVDLNNYVNYWFYFSLPYIWIAFFVIWSFLIKWLKNNRSYNIQLN